MEMRVRVRVMGNALPVWPRTWMRSVAERRRPLSFSRCLSVDTTTFSEGERVRKSMKTAVIMVTSSAPPAMANSSVTTRPDSVSG